MDGFESGTLSRSNSNDEEREKKLSLNRDQNKKSGQRSTTIEISKSNSGDRNDRLILDSSRKSELWNNVAENSSHSELLTLDVGKLRKKENGYVEIRNLIIEMIDVIEDETKYIQCIKKLVWIENCRKKGISVSHVELEHAFQLNHNEPNKCIEGKCKGKAKHSRNIISERENRRTKNKSLVTNIASNNNFENRKLRGKLEERIKTREKVLRQWNEFDHDKESNDFFIDKIIDLEEQFLSA